MVDECTALEPLGIGTDFARLREWAETLVDGYGAAPLDPVRDYAQAKRDRAYFNGLVKDIDQRRKAVKEAYTAPLKAFEDECKSVTAILQGAADQAGAVVAEGDRLYREAKEQALRDHFEDFAGELARVVRFEQLEDPKWLNRTTRMEDAQRLLESKIEAVARDWGILARFVGEEGYAAARLEFRRTLDLGEALKAKDEAAEAGKEIRELDAFRGGRERRNRWTIAVDGATSCEISEVLQVLQDMGVRACATKCGE